MGKVYPQGAVQGEGPFYQEPPWKGTSPPQGYGCPEYLGRKDVSQPPGAAMAEEGTEEGYWNSRRSRE